MTDTAEAELALGASISANVRRQRKARSLSLDALAQLAGLSKGTVVAIEREEANPSIGVLCRLAAALSLSVADLLSHDATETDDLIARAQPRTLWSTATGSFARLESSTSGQVMFELWSWQIIPGDRFEAEAHSPGTQELISVGEGVLRIAVGTEVSMLRAGEAAILRTDHPHAYAAEGDGPVVFTMAVLERGRMP